MEKIIKYEFKDKSVLNLALTHSSFAYAKKVQNNERLEFLGDSVLSFIVTKFLFENFDMLEGDLSQTRAKIVGRENLSNVISNLNLDKFLKVFPENLNISSNMKCDLYEAILGAIFLDGGLEKAEKFVLSTLNLTASGIKKLNEKIVDYKTMLQELLQKNKAVNIEYRELSHEFKNGENSFKIGLFVDDKKLEEGFGASKHIAENISAKKLYEKLKSQ